MTLTITNADEATPAAGIQLVPLATLRASPLNPRKRFDDTALNELAESIHTEGLLQNLVVRPSADYPGHYEIAAGERRLRAMLRLYNQGRWPHDRPVPVVVRDLTDLELLQLATTENLARADMTPMEEARAFARMLELGSDVETIALETGLSERTVRTRLTLAERLAPKAVELLEAGRLTLGQAQALTAANVDTQERVLHSSFAFDLEDPTATLDDSPADLRHALAYGAIPASRAKFPLAQYTGTFTEPSLFDPDAEPTFDDVEQFHRLQRAWADKLIEAYRGAWAWVEERPYFYRYEFETPAKGEHLGPKDLGVVVVYDGRTGELEVHEGLKRQATERHRSSREPGAEADPLALTQRHQAVIYGHRTRALQTAMLEARRGQLTTAVNIIGLLHLHWADTLIRTEVVQVDQSATAVQETIEQAAQALGVEKLLTYEYAYQVRAGALSRTTHLLKALLEQPIDRLLDLQAALVALHTRAGTPFQASTRMDETTRVLWAAAAPEEHLPTWRDLGADWLQLYPKARLEQLHADATGLESTGMTRKAMVAGILDHAKPGWLDQVPDELHVPDQAEAVARPDPEQDENPDPEDEDDPEDDWADQDDDEGEPS